MLATLAVIGVAAVVILGFGGYAVIRFFRTNQGAIQAVDRDSMRFNPWPGRTGPERLPGADMYPSDPPDD